MLKICFPEKRPKIVGQKSRPKKVSKKGGNKRQQKMRQERWEKVHS